MQQRWGLPLIAWPSRLRPNYWDLVALPLVLGLIGLIAWGGMAMGAHYQVGEALAMSLDPGRLPEYALHTVLRMAWALVGSLVFSLAYAALAAKSRQAEKILIPVLDILQSVPILGFLSITVTGFIALFPGRLLGVECAAIFAIFTSQAWNMTFSVYQSLRTVPMELIEAARMYHLSPWRRFWRLEVPHAIPSLVWNMMMSVSGGWFFVVASEAITVSGQSILLPGIGSYIATAIVQRSLTAIGWAVLVMLVVILLYDQLLFRPLIAWSRKFQGDPSADADNVRPWLLIVLQRARLFDLVQTGLLAVNRMIDTTIAALTQHRSPGADPDRDRLADLGSDRRVDRSASGAGRPCRADRPVPRRLPGKFVFSGGGGADPAVSPRPGNLAQSADDPRHPMVHSVQRHRRHDDIAGGAASRGAEFRCPAALMVAPGDPAGDLP